MNVQALKLSLLQGICSVAQGWTGCCLKNEKGELNVLNSLHFFSCAHLTNKCKKWSCWRTRPSHCHCLKHTDAFNGSLNTLWLHLTAFWWMVGVVFAAFRFMHRSFARSPKVRLCKAEPCLPAMSKHCRGSVVNGGKLQCSSWCGLRLESPLYKSSCCTVTWSPARGLFVFPFRASLNALGVH